MTPSEVHVEWILGRSVRDRSGRILGRLEEIRTEKRRDVFEVTEYLVGPWGWLERLSLSHLRPLRRWKGFRLRWDQLDLSDPRRPRLTCSKREIERVPHPDAGETGERARARSVASHRSV